MVPAIQEELADALNHRQDAGLTLEQWCAQILMRLSNQAMEEVTQAKCAHWCNHVNRFIPASMAQEDILG